MDAHKCTLVRLYMKEKERVHQENIINGNRSRIWLGLTPVGRGQAQGDEAPRQILRGYQIE